MEDLFRSYWWLLFPLGYFVFSAFDQYMRYRRHRDTLDLIKTYADQGRDPPPELMARLKNRSLDPDDGGEDDEDEGDYRARRRRYRRYRHREGRWYQVVLFGVMAAGFGYGAATDIYGAGEAFVIVTFVMGALCLASLVTALTSRRD